MKNWSDSRPPGSRVESKHEGEGEPWSRCSGPTAASHPDCASTQSLLPMLLINHQHTDEDEEAEPQIRTNLPASHDPTTDPARKIPSSRRRRRRWAREGPGPLPRPKASRRPGKTVAALPGRPLPGPTGPADPQNRRRHQPLAARVGRCTPREPALQQTAAPPSSTAWARPSSDHRRPPRKTPSSTAACPPAPPGKSLRRVEERPPPPAPPGLCPAAPAGCGDGKEGEEGAPILPDLKLPLDLCTEIKRAAKWKCRWRKRIKPPAAVGNEEGRRRHRINQGEDQDALKKPKGRQEEGRGRRTGTRRERETGGAADRGGDGRGRGETARRSVLVTAGRPVQSPALPASFVQGRERGAI
jgi:hypothetical protein